MYHKVYDLRLFAQLIKHMGLLIKDNPVIDNNPWSE